MHNFSDYHSQKVSRYHVLTKHEVVRLIFSCSVIIVCNACRHLPLTDFVPPPRCLFALFWAQEILAKFSTSVELIGVNTDPFYIRSNKNVL